MSDNRTGPPHDLPKYVPNWPKPIKIKAKVHKLNGVWVWSHVCPRGLGIGATLGYAQPTQPAAFEAAMKHTQGCW